MPTDKLAFLHSRELKLRARSLKIISKKPKTQIHIRAIEEFMDLADVIRQFDTNDEDFKVVQVFSMRAFNAFAASTQLALSGYYQISAMILRDILEMNFLLDYFSREISLLKAWRKEKSREHSNLFKPVKVRSELDKKDGFKERKREARYKMFSELAAHPTMQSAHLLRPTRNGDALIGPFVVEELLDAIFAESGRMAIEIGEKICRFMPRNFVAGQISVAEFKDCKKKWMNEFFPNSETEK